MVEAFDWWVSGGLNQLARTSVLFDVAVALMVNEPFLRNGVLVAILWWAWAGPRRARLSGTSRLLVVARSTTGALAAVVLARLAQNLLPPRPRPLHDPAHEFVTPFGLSDTINRDWSSFPSDTATLAFALVTAIWIQNRRAGVLALGYALVFVCLPRVYAGLHFVSDLAAGAAIGAAVMGLALRLPLPAAAEPGLRRLALRHGAVLSAALFVLAAQLAMEFRTVRNVAGGLATAALAPERIPGVAPAAHVPAMAAPAAVGAAGRGAAEGL